MLANKIQQMHFKKATLTSRSREFILGGGARWQRSRRPKFLLIPGIQLDRDQTILNTYELNRISKKRIAATL